MKLLAAILTFAGLLAAADCAPSQLGEKETLAKFQELDRAAQAAFDQGRFGAAAGHYREAACLVPKAPAPFTVWASPKRLPAASPRLERPSKPPTPRRLRTLCRSLCSSAWASQ